MKRTTRELSHVMRRTDEGTESHDATYGRGTESRDKRNTRTSNGSISISVYLFAHFLS